ncbi:MAG: hypothetical protein HOO99_01100 [Hyphomicrobiaceae bacterium]|nr:hypothetical protein [Hyphomicrobium sp.]NOU04755.1 hypothetical protein [Hyphomicrobiaceae bacterium]
MDDEFYRELSWSRQQAESAKQTPIFIFALFGCVCLALFVSAIRTVFIDPPTVKRVLSHPHRVSAELLGCHTTFDSISKWRYSADYRWTGVDGVVRSVAGHRIPNLDIFAKVCGGKPVRIDILASETEPTLRPVIEASKEIEAREETGASAVSIVVLGLAAMVLGSLLSFRTNPKIAQSGRTDTTA